LATVLRSIGSSEFTVFKVSIVDTTTQASGRRTSSAVLG
jgi:hypothetical protein